MADEVDPQSIPEVGQYLEAMQKLEEFVAQHPDVFAHVRQLIEEADTLRQAADKAVTGRKVLCGPWRKHRENTSYNATELLDAMGFEKFLEVGGKKTTSTTYSVDANQVKAAIAIGAIPPDVAERITEVKLAYSKPKTPTV